MESNYIIKQGNLIYPFEFEDEGKKYLLNPNKLENEVLRIYFRQDIQQCLGGSQHPQSSQVAHSLRSFGEMLSYMNLFLYDAPEYTSLYPNGFHTENKIFIPVQLFANMIDKETGINTRLIEGLTITNAPVMVMKSLISVLENLYEIKFSDREKQDVIYAQISNTSYDNQAKQSMFRYAKEDSEFGNLSFISTKDLESSFTENNFPSSMVEYLSASNDSSFIDIILSKSQELFNQSHPLFKFQSKVMGNMASITTVSTNQSLEELVNSISATNPQDLMKVTTVLSTSAKSIIEENLGNNSDITGIINALAKEWIPAVMQLEDGPFSVSYINLLTQLNGTQKFQSSDKTNLLKTMTDNEYCDGERTDFIIALSSLTKMTRYKVTYIHKEKDNNQNMFFEACSKGDIATIKSLLNIANEETCPDIASSHNRGFNNAAKNNQKEVMLYLIAGSDLKQHVDMNEACSTIKGHKHIDVFEELVSKKLLKDKSIGLDLAFYFGKGDIVKKILAPELTETEIVKMFEILQGVTTSNDVNFEMSQIVLDKVMSIPNVQQDFYRHMERLFFSAARDNKEDLLRALVFDHNIELVGAAKEMVESDYPQINNFFKLRDLNEKLTQNLPVSESKARKNKI